MEQLEFDCRLESERELEENVNIALEFACKQVKETSKSKVSNRHDGYGIASEFYTSSPRHATTESRTGTV